jgi:serine protease Do
MNALSSCFGSGRTRTIGGIAAATVLSFAVAAPGYAASAPDSFADLAERVSPAVVNVSSTHVMADQGVPLPFSFPPGSPFEDFFRQFQGPQDQQGQQPRPERQVTSLGSGFIIDASGYIVTNNHVIDDAKDIEVTLTDGSEYPAKLIGTDPKTDLALLKVESKTPLPYVPFGDSDKLRIGDWVMAVGNPFGLGGTVTAGIVSARGRDIHGGPYDDFLQIDAAINQGNSGGPTFGLDGSVIGINTAIYSPSGGSVGIGFAIPSNLAKPIIAELKEQGHVDRGWLGVSIQELTPDLTQGMDLDTDEGALIASVQEGSPAAEAGLQAGDVVVGFGEHDITSPKDLSRVVAETASNTTVAVKVRRDGSERVIDVTIAEMENEIASADRGGPDAGDGPANSDSVEQLGAVLAPVTEETRQQYDLADGIEGAVVADLEQDSVLAEQGVRPGDVIERVNNRKVAAPSDVAKELREAREDDRSVAVMLIDRDGNDRFVAVQIGQS